MLSLFGDVCLLSYVTKLLVLCKQPAATTKATDGPPFPCCPCHHVPQLPIAHEHIFHLYYDQVLRATLTSLHRLTQQPHQHSRASLTPPSLDQTQMSSTADNIEMSRLLQLPPEIRTTIYQHIFSVGWAPYVDVATRPAGQGATHSHEYFQDLSVLLTCTTIYQEARPLFADSVHIHCDAGAQPSDLPLAIQQYYFPHIKHVKRIRYDKDEPLDLTPLHRSNNST